MTLGHPLEATVKIGSISLGECEVIPALDGTMTVKFERDHLSLDAIDSTFQDEPPVTITEPDGTVTEDESRALQAYRIDGNGKAEVSFLTNMEVENDEV